MPCTLLGAVCYERGDCEQGREWYDKAVKRGFKEADRDRELRSIFWRLDPKKQAEMRAHLLGMDPERYKWAASNVKPTRRPAASGRSGFSGASSDKPDSTGRQIASKDASS